MTDHIDPVANARRLTDHYAEQDRKRQIARLEGRLALAEALAEEGAYDRPQGPGDDPVGWHPEGYSGPSDPVKSRAELMADLKQAIKEQGNPFA